MMNAFNMNGLTNHIIAITNKNNFLITNLKLQKILYFVMRYAILHNSFTSKQLKKLYNEPFLVWRYGPVIKNIYEEYKIFGSDPIIENVSLISIFNRLNQEIIKLLKKSTWKLVQESHQFPYWKNNSQHINGWRSNIKYSLSNIKTGK